MSEQTIPIPGRLKNVAIGGHVAGSEDIDAGGGKTQKQVNDETNDTLALHQSEISGLNSQNYVSVSSYSSLPATGSADTIYRVSSWDGNANSGEGAADVTKYTEYAWNGTAYIVVSVKTQIGEVFDISEYKAVGGTLAKFADLSAALDNGNNVPVGVRKGGMSVKFVQSSDNMYVQYRLVADEWSTDTKDWAIYDSGIYVDNPEFVYVKTDSEGKIIWAIKTDGSIYYGAGVPSQIVNYINEKIEELSLDEYEDIVTFLGNLIEGDTLATLLNGKVDKETGKSLIPTQYIQDTENPEFVRLYVDGENKILFGVKTNGDFYFGYGVPSQIAEQIAELQAELQAETTRATNAENSLGNFETNFDYIKVITDKERKILYAIRADGTKVDYTNTVYPNGIPEQIKSYINSKTGNLEGKELFTIGDSLSYGGFWQQVVSEITGCFFDETKNVKPGSQLSTGGTVSYGGSKDCGLARITNLKKETYNPDIIVLQNINDFMAFSSTGQPISGNINDSPYIINQILEGYSLSDWEEDASSLLSSISANDRKYGTVLLLDFLCSGKNMKILTTASNEGDITIKIDTAQTSLLQYGIHVTPLDSINDILDKILEYNYTMVTDTLGDDGESVDFSTGNDSLPCTVYFEDTGNTGVTVSITDTNSAKGTSRRIFYGDNLTSDWEDSSKWGTTITFYSAWKGMIEFAKMNFPAAELVVLLFPRHAMNPNNYMNTDGTFDQEAYNATLTAFNAMFTAQKQVAQIYNIPVIDIVSDCGITVGNYSEYYYNNNVHPKAEGFAYFGKMIAKKLLNIV